MPNISPAGTHPVASTEPPATAAALGLTDEPVAVTTPPPPLFKESKRRPPTEGTTEPPTEGSEGQDWPPVSEAAGNADASSTTTEPLSPGSTDRQPAADPRPLRDLPALRDGIAQAVHAVGDELNDRTAPGTDLWLTDEQDEQGLATPVSRLILRHLPAELGGAGNPDFVDAVSAAIVLARYTVKQLNLMRALRREARAAADAGQVPYGAPPASEPAAA
jgi:hypothetical protein